MWEATWNVLSLEPRNSCQVLMIIFGLITFFLVELMENNERKNINEDFF